MIIKNEFLINNLEKYIILNNSTDIIKYKVK